ncbi:ATP-binding protein [Streptomyces kaniharaensis]|uniref:ATP-binding protein n=1 Tax=Streptomyces kaniharaensis TaxID=212423 RepID=A0A6N7KVF0_9ACTN|nr:ATP-binding protein [Streptomyces kaniharaensis]MQS13954.1 ATP-binding protein [Streptomyces kaniharaensis]
MPETVSPTPTEQTCWLPRHHKSPRAARQELRSFLLPLPVGEHLLPTGELLLSELVTNAVQHARTPRDCLIFIRFHLIPDATLRIEVHDADSEKPSLRAASGSDETGRGLLLVRELATQWGCCPRAGGIGKFVWCHISPEVAAA